MVDGFVISIPTLDVGGYTLTVTAIADVNHNNITKNATITVNNLKTELTDNAITTTYNINNDFIITINDNTGKSLSDVKVIINLNNAKTYTTARTVKLKSQPKDLLLKPTLLMQYSTEMPPIAYQPKM